MEESTNSNNQNLLDFTTQLLETVTADQVAKKFIDYHTKLFESSACSIVILKNEFLHIMRTQGYPSFMVKRWKKFSITDSNPISDAVRLKKTIYISDHKKLQKMYPHMLDFTVRSKIKIWAALPIVYRKKVLGGIVLSFKNERKFTTSDKTYFLTVTQQISQALERAQLYEAEKNAHLSLEESREKIRFLNEATKILASSLDYKKTLANLAKIVVPNLAEWCGIDIITEENKLQNLVVAHQNAERVKLAKILQKRYPADLNSPSGVAAVIKSGEPEIINNITKDMIKRSARDKDHLKLLIGIGFKSVMIVPLKGQSKTLGAITFVTSKIDKQFTKEDLFFAQELAARAATAIDNAILYQRSLEGIRIRDEFLNIAAHELRTPLTSLQLQIQLLMNFLNTSKDGKVAFNLLSKSLSAGEQQTKRLGNLINNLLDVSRMSNKKIELEKDRVELNSLLKEVITRFDTSLKHTGTKIVYKNGQKVSGRWDRFKLDQVITNLISNAIKYGEGNPINLTVKKKKNRAYIHVKDHGMGMGQEDLKKIFNRFVRTEAAKKYGGLGLGLYISKQIVDAHGGNIVVNSTPNAGTEFIIKLPLN